MCSPAQRDAHERNGDDLARKSFFERPKNYTKCGLADVVHINRPFVIERRDRAVLDATTQSTPQQRHQKNA
jgi:hypothetical protein